MARPRALELPLAVTAPFLGTEGGETFLEVASYELCVASCAGRGAGGVNHSQLATRNSQLFYFFSSLGGPCLDAAPPLEAPPWAPPFVGELPPPPPLPAAAPPPILPPRPDRSSGFTWAAARFSRRIASYTSLRWTLISFGALIPRRTLSPRMSTTVTSMSSPIMIVSSRCLDSTNIARLLPG